MFVECPIIISFVEEAIIYINSALRQDLIISYSYSFEVYSYCTEIDIWIKKVDSLAYSC